LIGVGVTTRVGTGVGGVAGVDVKVGWANGVAMKIRRVVGVAVGSTAGLLTGGVIVATTWETEEMSTVFAIP
jgi:hypothetical protein